MYRGASGERRAAGGGGRRENTELRGYLSRIYKYIYTYIREKDKALLQV